MTALRLLKTSVISRTIEKGVERLEDQDVAALVRKAVKQRQDSIEQFKNGGRSDLADKESLELVVLKKYLPPELSDEDLRKAVGEVVSETGAQGNKDFGRVMKACMERLKGACDGKSLSGIIREMLGAG